MTGDIGADGMRESMRRVPSPVSVVTCGRGQNTRGITIGSLASTALEPALVSFNLAHAAQMHEVLPFEEEFLVHVLAEDQSVISERFAIPNLSGAEQFVDVATTENDSGLIIIAGTALTLRCRLQNVFPAGDHSLIVGRVVEVLNKSDRSPLLYWNRDYREVGSVAKAGGIIAASSSGTS